MPGLLPIRLNSRTLKRYRQVIKVFLKYGFENLLESMNLAQFVARGWRFFYRREPEIAFLSPAERMRLAFEELGPTFIKLGQLLSTRSDVVPPPYLSEFSKLQDSVPGFAFDEVRGQIRRELGGEVEDLYASFETKPVAAASIAQVHIGRLITGEEVAVKVRRPGILEAVETDIDVLNGLAMLVERYIQGSEVLDPVALVREFARTIRREMDLSREGVAIEKMSANFEGDETLYFPKVYWDRTSSGILTLQQINGIKISDTEALERAGLDRRLVAKRGATAFLRQVLEHGYFHGDPHPGNILVLPGNVVCLLDYGIVGRLDSFSKEFLVDFLLSVLRRDAEKIVSLMLYSGDITDIPNTRFLKRDLSDFIDRYHELPPRQVLVGRMLVDFIEIISAYQIKFRPDFMLLAKALVIIEGIGRHLDEDFNALDLLRPFVEKAAKDKVSPSRVLGEFYSHLSSYVNLAKNLPEDLKEILNRLNRNKFKIDLEHRGLDHFIRELDRCSNRLSSSLVITAIIVGSSLIMQTQRGPLLLGFPVLAVLGYLIAGVLGLWLVFGIFRSGRL